jgi:hypothetical protein
MNSLLMLAMLVAVPWLVVWIAIEDRSKYKGWWWPFDYREAEEDETKEATTQETTRRWPNQKAQSTPPWRRRN